MAQLAKDRNRRLFSEIVNAASGGETYLLLVEETAYIPTTGYSRRKWDTQRVTITLEELRDLAKMYLGNA